jgi:tRNA (adenine22-N1)-methyltransferase
MDKPALDERLRICASLVRESARLADVGTDHAYLPIWLLKSGKINYAIASDINEKPLESGESNAKLYGEKNIEFRLGSGLNPIKAEDRITDIVIAGMGGEVISEIIDESPLTKDKNINLILQPMTRSEELIKFLYKNGFEIEKQKCVFCKGKCYTVLSARFTGKKTDIDDVFPYIGKLDLNDEVNRRFAQIQIRNLENKSKGDSSLLPIIDSIKKRLV